MKTVNWFVALSFISLSSEVLAVPVPKMDPVAARELWQKSTAGTNVALHSKVIFSTQPTYNLTVAGGTDANDLTDGMISEASYEDRIWFDAKAVGWYESGASGGFNILMDLGKVQPIDHAVLRALGGKYNWSMSLPQRFEVYISKDGKDFYPVVMLDKLKPGESAQSDWVKNYYVEEGGIAFVYPFEFKIRSEARYIGITVVGETDAVFMDEIAVMAPQSPLAPAEIAAPYKEKATVFHTAGLVVAPRIGKLVISSNIYTPNYFVAKDMRPGKGLADPLHLAVDVPENVDIVLPRVESREKIKVDGKNYQRLTITISKCQFKIPFTNGIFFTVKGGVAADATATISDADNKIDPVRQTFPIEIIKIPEVDKPFKQLQISLSWMDEAEGADWPNFINDWKKFGFNAVGTFPRYYQSERKAGEPDKIQRFLADARKNGYKIIMQEFVGPGVARDQKPGSEMFSQLDSNDSKSLCPSYRGVLYQQELERIKKNTLACRPDFVIWDNECWYVGAGDGLSGRCRRCKEAAAASGKPMDQFLIDCGTEILRDGYQAIKDASVEGKFPMPLVSSYNYQALHPVSEEIFDFKRCYPKYLNQSQPSLYVGGRAAMVHKSIRGNYQLLKNRDILAWLSAGTYGEMEPRKLEQEILEVLLNGAIGFTYYWSGDFDTPLEYYYHTRPLAILRPYEDLLVNGNVLEPTGSNTALYYSGIGRKNEMLLLVGNYDSAPEATACKMPEGIKKATDLFSGEKLKVVDSKLSITVPKDGVRLLYCEK